jgi:hypothetical protein
MSFTTADDAEGRINFRISEALGTAWIDDLRLTEGAPAKATPVFVREFAKGLVIVRPPEGTEFTGPSGIRLNLPSPMKPLLPDGTAAAATGSVDLKNGEAAILLHP